MAKTRGKKRSRRKPKTVRPPALAADPQIQSMLFGRLPQELRDQIYSALFFSTRFSSGGRAVTRIDCITIKPAPNALSVLQTCRRARAEIGDSWIGQVLFSFESPEAMLDKLTAVSPGILSKVRHLRVSGDPLMLSFGYDDVYYRLMSTLKLLPGLRLDVLTVLGDRVKEVSYETLNGLIREACGWKELRYITHNSEVLGYARDNFFRYGVDDDYPYWRKPQPAHWQTVLDDKDGALSRPSVAIYRSTLPGCPGSVLNPKTRAGFEQKMPKDRAGQETFGIGEDTRLMADGERVKEMMIVAKRGSSVDYEEKKDSPLLENDIRRELPGRTWKEIRRECIDFVPPEYDDEDDWPFSNDEDDGDPTEIDAYGEVDEYVWPPVHFLDE